MNYRMRRQGEDLGVFTLEELRRHRESGELTGGEYIQGEGMPDWQPLDLVLQQGYRVVPPPLPLSVSKGGLNPGAIWLMVVVGVIVFVAFCVFVGLSFQRGYQSAINSARTRRSLNQSRPEAMTAASKPVTWTTNTLTTQDIQKRGREFRIRQWLEGYEKRGQHNPACNAGVTQYLQTWIARNYGGPEATNSISIERVTEQLAADTNCIDPLVLTVVANNSRHSSNIISRLERALDMFPQSNHKAYPRLYATVVLAGYLSHQPARVGALDRAALEWLGKCFADGSFTPADQQEIANIFVNGWGDDFLKRNGAAICKIMQEAGPAYQWLALTLEGEHHITEAWKARGDGYANSVTQQGWQDFHSHLAAARKSLTEAWTLQPGFPLAPCRMMAVSLGESGIDEMRVWFDRTLAAQVDCPEAWSEMRWGLRPRWYGNETAMLALGKTAINTGRFDTDVPRKFVDCVYDVESEMHLSAGHHIYGRSDVWPDLQRVYEGYLRQAQPYPQRLQEWQTAYAVIACFAGKYDVARNQLEALNWKPQPGILAQWKLDATLWPLEIAARTGPLGKEISNAETAYQNKDKDFIEALKQYKNLNSAAGADERTGEFIHRRLASLQPEQPSLQSQFIHPQPYQSIPPPATN